MDTLYKVKQIATSTPGVLDATVNNGNGPGIMDLKPHTKNQAGKYTQMSNIHYYIKT